MSLAKRSFRLAGHATSVALEPDFWTALEQIAAERGQSLPALVASVDTSREDNLASALRVFVLTTLQRRAPDATT